MVILLWVAVAVVVANAIFGAFLVIRYRGERRRAAEARHRLPESARWRTRSAGGSSHLHLT
jgi:uncharacterized membrane protein YsdA (DUF1294 family)